jgi:hypothetical protein
MKGIGVGPAPHTKRGESGSPSQSRPGAPHTRETDRTRTTEAPAGTAAPAPGSTSRGPPALITCPTHSRVPSQPDSHLHLGYSVRARAFCSASLGLFGTCSHRCTAAATRTFILGQLVDGDEHLVERPELRLGGTILSAARFCSAIVWRGLRELRPAHRPALHAQSYSTDRNQWLSALDGEPAEHQRPSTDTYTNDANE